MNRVYIYIHILLSFNYSLHLMSAVGQNIKQCFWRLVSTGPRFPLSCRVQYYILYKYVQKESGISFLYIDQRWHEYILCATIC